MPYKFKQWHKMRAFEEIFNSKSYCILTYLKVHPLEVIFHPHSILHSIGNLGKVLVQTPTKFKFGHSILMTIFFNTTLNNQVANNLSIIRIERYSVILFSLFGHYYVSIRDKTILIHKSRTSF